MNQGDNISGGQKQRICLARAMYGRPNILILDNPFNALDSNVKEKIIDRVIFKGKKEQLIVICENSFDLRPYASHHIFINLGGAELKPHWNPIIWKNPTLVPKKLVSNNGETSSNIESGTSILKGEDNLKGKISKTVLVSYLKAVGNGGLILIVLFFLLKEIAELIGNFAIANHVNRAEGLKEFLSVYIKASGMVLLFITLRSLLIGLFTLRGSDKIFRTTLTAVLNAPLKYFWKVSSSKILNRFSKDIDSLDQVLPGVLIGLIMCFFTTLGIVFAVAYTVPVSLIVFLPLAIIYWYIQRFFRPTSRDVKRLNATTRTPLFSALSEVIEGSRTANLYGKSKILIERYFLSLDLHQRALHSMLIINRWLGSRLVVISSGLIGVIGVFAVLQMERGNAGWWGMAFAYGFSLTNVLTWGVQAISDTEAEFSAVERMQHLQKEFNPEKKKFKPNSNLIKDGTIRIKNASFSYQKDTLPIIENLNLSIPHGQKVGILGRTGSGKSTLINLLSGIISSSEGTIEMGGRNIEAVDYAYLRQFLNIIPQNPILVPGSVGENLDPDSNYEDQYILELLQPLWGMDLDRCALKQKAINLSNEHQLAIGVVRAILSKPKILLLDEVTSQTDQENDSELYNYIWNSSGRPTLMVVSHNIKGLVEMDRVIVISKGVVVYDGHYQEDLARLINYSDNKACFTGFVRILIKIYFYRDIFI